MPRSMFSNMLPHGVRHGLTMLRRDRSYAPLLATLAGTIFLFQLLGIVALSVGHAETLLTQSTDVHFTLLPMATQDQTQALFAAIKKESFVQDAVYITSEQAYQEERSRDPAFAALVDKAQLGNPFHDTIAVRLRQGSSAAALQQWLQADQWASVVDAASIPLLGSQDERGQELLGAAHIVGLVSTVLLFLALAVVVFILVMSFDARAELRAEEMTVSRLLGAPASAVLLPFVTEATILLLLASVIAGLAVTLLVFLIPIVLPTLLIGTALPILWDSALSMLVAFLPFAVLLHVILAPIIGWTGVKLGVRMQPLSLA